MRTIVSGPRMTEADMIGNAQGGMRTWRTQLEADMRTDLLEYGRTDENELPAKGFSTPWYIRL